MKKFNAILLIAVSALVFASCQKGTKDFPDENVLRSESTLEDQADVLADRSGNNSGNVYTMTNSADGNKIKVFKRGHDGSLTYQATYSSGGNGTGSGLGNQGGLVLSEDEKTLITVNAGSNNISSFKVAGNGQLVLKSTISSGGMMPVSVTIHDDLVYVLNAGGTGNISGFKLGPNDKLYKLHNSTRPLTSSSAGAAQVSFVRNGNILAITEKATDKIVTYRVGASGRPFGMKSITSASPTPFGFAADHFGNIYVSEAVGGAAGASTVSSYHISFNGDITLTEGPVGAGQSAACWVVLTGNDQYAYVTNAASNNISSFSIQPHSGNLDVLEADAAGADGGPIDAALTKNSKYLYVLNSGGHSISAYEVSNNGGLTSIGTVGSLPMGTNGLAAR